MNGGWGDGGGGRDVFAAKKGVGNGFRAARMGRGVGDAGVSGVCMDVGSGCLFSRGVLVVTLMLGLEIMVCLGKDGRLETIGFGVGLWSMRG